MDRKIKKICSSCLARARHKAHYKKCFLCLGEFKRVRVENLSEKKEICPKHNEEKKKWKEISRGKVEVSCSSCIEEWLEQWKKQLKHLKLDPLSVAKFFYERGVNDIALIQRLIYLVYIEVLKKERKLLFEELWQAWNGGPVLESIFYQMMEYSEKHGNYQSFFKKVSPLDDKKIIRYCEEWFVFYQECEKNNQRYKISEQAQNWPWELVNSKSKHYLKHKKIELGDIGKAIEFEEVLRL